MLPPRTTAEGTVAAYLRNDTAGLPSQAQQASYETTGYKPRLSVDFVGQPTVGVGVDSFGTYVGGGISASFSDILGNHVVAGSIQTTNRLDETGGSIMYLNRSHRWNYGVALDSTPYVQRGIGQGLVNDGGQVLFERDGRPALTGVGAHAGEIVVHAPGEHASDHAILILL